MTELDAAIARVMVLSWEVDEAASNLHIALMMEYLRRKALWCSVLGVSENWILRDLASTYMPDREIAEEKIGNVVEHLRKTTLDWFGIDACKAYLRWQAIGGPQIAADNNLPSPYETAILTLEHRGNFRVDHSGFLEVDDNSSAIYLRSRDYYAQQEPYTNIVP
jgi:hypothetical protein